VLRDIFRGDPQDLPIGKVSILVVIVFVVAVIVFALYSLCVVCPLLFV
jgi:hypothetical protein